jgi:hypothetical protein
MQGFVYIMTSKAMPGLVKVGMTTRGPWERAVELSAPSGVPSRFVVERAFPVVHAYQAEQHCHEALGRYRGSQDREFFMCNVETAVAIVEVTLEQEELLDTALCVDRPESRTQLARFQSLFDSPDGALAERVATLVDLLENALNERSGLQSALGASEQEVERLRAAIATIEPQRDKLQAEIVQLRRDRRSEQQEVAATLAAAKEALVHRDIMKEHVSRLERELDAQQTTHRLFFLQRQREIEQCPSCQERRASQP